MSLIIRTRQANEVAILDLAGSIKLGEDTAQLRDAIRKAPGTPPQVLLNLAQVDYLDSAGLGELVGSYTSVAGRGGTVKLLHPQKKLTSLLTLTKLYTVFESFNDEVEAVASFQPKASASNAFQRTGRAALNAWLPQFRGLARA